MAETNTSDPTLLQPCNRGDLMEAIPFEKQTSPVSQPADEIENVYCQPDGLLAEGYIVKIQQVRSSFYLSGITPIMLFILIFMPNELFSCHFYG